MRTARISENRKTLSFAALLIFMALSVFGSATCSSNLKGVQATVFPPTPTATFQPGAPLLTGLISLPPGFQISVFAQGLDQPARLAIGADDQLYVSERGAGRILRMPDQDRDGVADAIQPVATGLDFPSGLAFFRDGSLYVGEAGQVVKLSEPDAQGLFQQREIIIADLPEGGHTAHVVVFSPDWSKLFVSIGSSCNNCLESDVRRATVMQANPDGGNPLIFVQGLGDPEGLAFRPGASQLWASNSGRELLGNDLPPDTLQILHQGQDFGWPGCHAGRIADPQTGDSGSCKGISTPAVELPAHSAPTGLTFYSGEQFPTEYQGNLFLALHGSSSREFHRGYKIVRIQFKNGRPGEVQDFATGWLQGNAAWGRPADLITASDGSLLVSDDEGGIIYRITYNQ
jgi:glucose/arabinose dehydrogenase